MGKMGEVVDITSSLRSRPHVDGPGAHLVNNSAEMVKFRPHQFHVSRFEILQWVWDDWTGT